MKKWYVVIDKNCTDPHPEEHVWTVSRDPDETGWCTDSGFQGYGLQMADAEELANAANDIERLRAALRLIAEHPVEQSGQWEVGAREMLKLARAALGGEND